MDLVSAYAQHKLLQTNKITFRNGMFQTSRTAVPATGEFGEVPEVGGRVVVADVEGDDMERDARAAQLLAQQHPGRRAAGAVRQQLHRRHLCPEARVMHGVK